MCFCWQYQHAIKKNNFHEILGPVVIWICIIVFSAEVWAVIKALEQIKVSVASRYILCLQAFEYMKQEHPLIVDSTPNFFNFFKQSVLY